MRIVVDVLQSPRSGQPDHSLLLVVDEQRLLLHPSMTALDAALFALARACDRAITWADGGFAHQIVPGRLTERLTGSAWSAHWGAALPGAVAAVELAPALARHRAGLMPIQIDLTRDEIRWDGVTLRLDGFRHGRADLLTLDEQADRLRDLRDERYPHGGALTGNRLIVAELRLLALDLLRARGTLEPQAVGRIAVLYARAIGIDNEHRFAQVFRRFAENEAVRILIGEGIAAHASWAADAPLVAGPAEPLAPRRDGSPKHALAVALATAPPEGAEAASAELAATIFPDDSHSDIAAARAAADGASAHARMAACRLLALVDAHRAAHPRAPRD